MRAAIQGEGDSLAWLVEHFSPLLRAQAEYRLGPTLATRVSIDDILQDAWLAVLPKLSDIVSQGGRYTPVLLSYLSKSVCGRAINHLRDHLRRASHHKALEVASPTSHLVAPNEGATAIIRSATGQATSSEFARTLSQVLRMLDPKEQEVLILRLVEGRTNAEVATELNERPNSISQRYRRALHILRERLPRSIVDEFSDS